MPAERNIPILTGLGGLYGFFDRERGSDGYNTGFAFPEILIAMVKADIDGAWEIYRRYLPLIVYEQQPGLASGWRCTGAQLEQIAPDRRIE